MQDAPHPDQPPAQVRTTCGACAWMELADWGRKKKCCKKYKKGKRCKDCPKK